MEITKTGEGLKRVVGLPAFSMSIVNNSIGSGMFVLPAIVGIQLGAFGIFCYLFCGIMLAAIMLCYAEAGSRITTSGGSYAYIEAAFGPFAGFITNWLYTFGWGILGSAAVMNILADSLSMLFPVFLNPFIRALLCFILITSLALINIRGAKEGARFVQILTVVKLLPLFMLIIFGLGHINAANLHWEHLPPLKTFGDTALVLFFAFAGFEISLNASGEIKNPKRNVPLGIFLGGMFSLIVYLLIQTVTRGVLGDQIVAFKDAPLAGVAENILGPAGRIILVAAAAFSCLGILSGDILATPRLLFAGANDGLFPKFLGKVHPKFATPHLAVITYTSLIFIFSISGGFKQLAILASAAILLVYLAVILATIKLRTKKQDAPGKTFSVPGGLVIPAIGIAAIVWLLTSLSKWEILSTIIFIAVVCVMYFITKQFKKDKSVSIPASE
jgi:basic amino acid/polyamine antiporter, APA family